MSAEHLMIYSGLVGLSLVVSLPLVVSFVDDDDGCEHYAFGWWLICIALSATTAGLWISLAKWLSRVTPNP